MDICKLCKTEGETAGKCSKCGNSYFNGVADFIYGKIEKESTGCECILTNKYLIVRHISRKEMLGSTTAVAAGGLLGAAVAGAVQKARKFTYGFYDLKEIDKVVYPFNAKGIKTDTAFKFILKDGSDFILHFDLNGMFCKKVAKNFLKSLETAGIKAEQGSSEKQPQCCQKPFVNKENFFLHVAHSAGKFVQLAEGQFIAPPCTADGSTTPLPETAPQPEATPTTTDSAAAEAPAKTTDTAPVEPPVISFEAKTKDSTMPEEETSAEEVTSYISEATITESAQDENTKPLRFCGKCGFPAYVADQLYCAECGAKLL